LFEGFVAAEILKNQVNQVGRKELYYFAIIRVWRSIFSYPD